MFNLFLEKLFILIRILKRGCNFMKIKILYFMFIVITLINNMSCSFAKSCCFDITSQMCKKNTLVGGKTVRLHNLVENLNINVPKGFCVSTQVYDAYLKSLKIENLINELNDVSLQWRVLKKNPEKQKNLERRIDQIAHKIQSRILNGTIDQRYLLEIERYYKQLSNYKQPALVAVRSSEIAEDSTNLSFAGQYDSYLNQRKLDQVIEALKKVWASAYNSKAIVYRNKNNILHNKIKMAAIVQVMVDAQSSGRAYSIDIETGAPFIMIKNLYGLGEAEASGEVSPDTWIINPNENIIIKRCLGRKHSRFEYDSLQEKTIVVENSQNEQKTYAITFEQAKKLVQEIKRIHKYFLNVGIENVEIEYAFNKQGDLFILQVRPETTCCKNRQKIFKAVNKEKVKNLLILEGGCMGCGGVATGPLRVLHSLEEAKARHKNGDIMVVGNTTNIWENLMVASGGIISQENVISSHAVATTREEGIPSLVGNPRAMELLGKYDGQTVTLDATLRRVYLGTISEENLYFPPVIETTFSGLDSVSEEEHWKSVSMVNLTDVDTHNKRWLKRPWCGNRTFQHEINKEAYNWVASKAFLPKLGEMRVVNGVMQVPFSPTIQWKEILRKKDLAYLEWITNERIKINNEHIQASLDLDYNATSVKRWINSAIKFYGMQNISYNLGQVTDELLNYALSQRRLGEPYLSQVRPLVEATTYGETLSKKRVRIFKDLIEQIKSQPQLLEDLRSMVNGKSDAENVFKNNHINFYKKLEQYVKNYRVIETASIDFAQPWSWFLKKVAQQLITEFDIKKEKDKIDHNCITVQEFFPEDAEFQKICKLAVLAQKLKLDGHHLHFRAHWKFREFIIPFYEFLKEKGVVIQFVEIFDHEPQWLVDQFERYKNEINAEKLMAKRE